MRGGLLSYLAALALLLAGTLGALSLPGKAQTQVTLDIDLREFAFDPLLIRVDPGAQVTLNLANIGSAEHTFTLFRARDPPVPEGFAMGPLGTFNATAAKMADVSGIDVDRLLNPGQSIQITFVAPTEVGPYVFVCMVSNHAELGMHGVLQVGEEPVSPLVIVVVLAVAVVAIAGAAFFLIRRRRQA